MTYHGKFSVAERFWSKVQVRSSDECWLWTASTSRGYGQMSVDGRPVRAHRIAFWLTHGFWPVFACHTCDTRLCCNPRHIYNGTAKSNLDDARARGRWQNPQAAANRIKTTCPKGHPYTAANTYKKRSGDKVRRVCRTCDLAAQALYRERKRSA